MTSAGVRQVFMVQSRIHAYHTYLRKNIPQTGFSYWGFHGPGIRALVAAALRSLVAYIIVNMHTNTIHASNPAYTAIYDPK